MTISAAAEELRWAWLGEVDYEEALVLQHSLRDQILQGRCGDTLLLLSHPPVITLGRSATTANILISHQERRRRGVKLVRTGRGGEVTFHGPGQLVGYPVRRVGRAVAAHVGAIIGILLELLDGLGIEGRWDEERPGVWTDQGKIAAVGVDARGGVALHGFALNLTTELSSFEMIVPCGYQAPVTSVAHCLELIDGQRCLPQMSLLARDVALGLARRHGLAPREVSPEELVP